MTKTHYLSREGLADLRQELSELSSVRRNEVAERISVARSHGDISENAEYEDAKNEQAFVEGRIATLTQIIRGASIIENPASTDVVGLGSTVTIRSDYGDERYTLVGSTEANPAAGRISNESPIGRAIMNRRRADQLTAVTPGGPFTFEIIAIE